MFEALIYIFIGGCLSAAFGPMIRLWNSRRREFRIHLGTEDSEEKDQAIAHLLWNIKQLNSVEVRTLAISVDLYETEKSFCAYGGSITNLHTAIGSLNERFAMTVAAIEKDYKDAEKSNG